MCIYWYILISKKRQKSRGSEVLYCRCIIYAVGLIRSRCVYILVDNDKQKASKTREPESNQWPMNAIFGLVKLKYVNIIFLSLSIWESPETVIWCLYLIFSIFPLENFKNTPPIYSNPHYLIGCILSTIIATCAMKM